MTVTNRNPHSPAPTGADRRKLAMLTWMRRRHIESVGPGSRDTFRRRVVPTSGMPLLVPACAKYPGLEWLPADLLVPNALPPESKLPRRYTIPYYGMGKLVWFLYYKRPVSRDVTWQPDFEWNDWLPPMADGWHHPTSDETFARLRLQGPNPWTLARVGGGDDDVYEQDYDIHFDGITDPVVCRFRFTDGTLLAESISVGGRRHEPGGQGWDEAKRLANALDARFTVFVRHLLHTHLIVGQAFAVAAYALPPWHPLRPFMNFFTYGTLDVNDRAYKSLLGPYSYFLRCGFVSPDDVAALVANAVARFDFRDWLVPHDLSNRGLDDTGRHPYALEAALAWAEFAAVVDRHLDELAYDDQRIAADSDLRFWHLTLAKVLPNTDLDERLTRDRLAELMTALLYNNVIHEVCGDFSPIMSSGDPADKAMTRLENVKTALADGGVTHPIDTPAMGDVFLIDQASFVSRFNVGGNKLIDVNAPRFIDDPKLVRAVQDMQARLTELDDDVRRRNDDREAEGQPRFERMRPSNWEASISF